MGLFDWFLPPLTQKDVDELNEEMPEGIKMISIKYGMPIEDTVRELVNVSNSNEEQLDLLNKRYHELLSRIAKLEQPKNDTSFNDLDKTQKQLSLLEERLKASVKLEIVNEMMQMNKLDNLYKENASLKAEVERLKKELSSIDLLNAEEKQHIQEYRKRRSQHTDPFNQYNK